MRNLPVVLSRAAVFLAAASASAGDPAGNWPQWRGPLGSGISATAQPPVKWSETEGVKWKTRIPGSGAATPIIWGSHVFVQTAIAAEKKVADLPSAIAGAVPAAQQQPPPDGAPRRRGGGGGPPRGEKPTEPHQFVLISVDRGTGKIRWQKTVREEIPHEGHHRDHGFSSHSPVTDGQHVYAYFGSRGLHAFDLEGNPKWSKDLGRMTTRNNFGEGSSPALHQNTLVVVWDHEGDDFIAAFDKNSGRELWRQARNEDTTWSTPLIIEHQGKVQVVTSGTRKIRSYDLATGQLLWECGGLTSNAVPMPVAGHGMVYLTTGHRGNALLAIKLGLTGDLTDSDAVVWRHQKSTPYVPSPLLSGNRLYFFSGNNGILSCFDALTGKPIFEAERLEGLSGVYASPVLADGRIYLAGRDGATVVLKDSDKLEVLANNRLDEKFDASPALAGKEIFLRGHQFLYCLSN